MRTNTNPIEIITQSKHKSSAQTDTSAGNMIARFRIYLMSAIMVVMGAVTPLAYSYERPAPLFALHGTGSHTNDTDKVWPLPDGEGRLWSVLQTTKTTLKDWVFIPQNHEGKTYYQITNRDAGISLASAQYNGSAHIWTPPQVNHLNLENAAYKEYLWDIQIQNQSYFKLVPMINPSLAIGQASDGRLALLNKVSGIKWNLLKDSKPVTWGDAQNLINPKVIILAQNVQVIVKYVDGPITLTENASQAREQKTTFEDVMKFAWAIKAGYDGGMASGELSADGGTTKTNTGSSGSNDARSNGRESILEAGQMRFTIMQGDIFQDYDGKYVFNPNGPYGSSHKTILTPDESNLKFLIGYYDATGMAASTGLVVEPFGGVFKQIVGFQKN